MGPVVGVLFNVIPYLQHGMFYECNLLRRLGPHGTVVWACYLMLFRTYGTGMSYECNLLRRFGPHGTVVWACYLMLFRTYNTISFMHAIC